MPHDTHVLAHPAASALLARLRATTTDPPAFRAAARRLGGILALAATEELPTRTETIATPLGPATAVVPDRPVVAVPVLRAGLGLLPGVQEVLPTSAVGMLGLERDPGTLQPRRYYEKLPPTSGAWVLVLEPMLATGGSAAEAALAVRGDAEQVTVLAVVSTPIAIERINDEAPGTRIVTAAVDTHLDENGYIVPGLGDFGDRLWGTPHA